MHRCHQVTAPQGGNQESDPQHSGAFGLNEELKIKDLN